MDRIIAVNSNTYHGYSVEDALRGISAAGFRYVELTATKGWTEHVFPTHSFASLIRVKKLMAELGLTPFALSGHCNLMDPERIQDFILNIELAAFLGSDYIVSSVGEAHLEDKNKEDLGGITENIVRLLPCLRAHGIKLVLETHGDHSTAGILKEIVGRVGSDLVAINYDTANVIYYAGVLPEVDMLDAIDQIAYLHLKDKLGGVKEWNFPALGKGVVNFPAIFSNLSAAKNSSPFSIELEFTPEGAGSLEAVNEAVRTSAAYLKSHGFVL